MHSWSLEGIKKRLQAYSYPHQQREADYSASAAVLLLLVEQDRTLSCLFIQRAKNPKDVHSGQIAFPGGRAEAQDKDEIATALRETQEEIGINVKRDEVMGVLPIRISRQQYQVRPVIACIRWPQDLVLQTEEVASVFTLPLDWLADQNNLDSATVLGLPENATIVYKAYNGHRLWGLTAKIIDDFLQVISTD